MFKFHWLANNIYISTEVIFMEKYYAEISLNVSEDNFK